MEQRDQPRTVARRFFEEVINAGRVDVVDELIADKFVDHEDLPGAGADARADLKSWLVSLRAAFPDYRVTIEDTIAEGDQVLVRGTAHGTHLGAFHGIPPTRRVVHYAIMDVLRVVDGRILEHWGLADTEAIAAQLGLLSEP